MSPAQGPGDHWIPPALGLGPEQRAVDAIAWQREADRLEAEGHAPQLAMTFRELAAWARGELEHVGPQKVNTWKARTYYAELERCRENVR